LLLPPAQMKRGDIGIVVVIQETTIVNEASGRQAVCRVRADRRCKVMDCWLTDQIEGLHSAQIDPFDDIQPSDTTSPAPPFTAPLSVASPSATESAADTIASTAVAPATATAVAIPFATSTTTSTATSVTPVSVNSSVPTQTAVPEPRPKQIAKWMEKIERYMEEADRNSDNQFTGRKNLSPAPTTNPTEMSWWIFKALAFDGSGLQARVPVFLTSSILHSRDPLWRLQIAVQLLQQLIAKLREHKAGIRNSKSPGEPKTSTTPHQPLMDQEGGTPPPLSFADSNPASVRPPSSCQ